MIVGHGQAPHVHVHGAYETERVVPEGQPHARPGQPRAECRPGAAETTFWKAAAQELRRVPIHFYQGPAL